MQETQSDRHRKMQCEKLNRNIISCFFFPLFLGRVLHYTSKCRLSFCLSIFKLISRESITTIYYSTYDDVVSLTNYILNHLEAISSKTSDLKTEILNNTRFSLHLLRFLWVSLAYPSWDVSNDMSHIGFRPIFGTISLTNFFCQKTEVETRISHPGRVG